MAVFRHHFVCSFQPPLFRSLGRGLVCLRMNRRMLVEYKMLRIDLSKRSYEVEEIPSEIIKNYIGGRGLGAYYLYRFVAQGIYPLAEENHLIFTVGPTSTSGAP